MSRNQLDQLLDRYQNGQCSTEEKRRIEEWLEKKAQIEGAPWHAFSEADKDAYVKRLYERINDSISANNTTPIHETPIRRWRNMKWMVAASVIILLSTYFALRDLTGDQQQRVHWETIVAKPGHQLRFTLADGSIVWLKGGSELRYP